MLVLRHEDFVAAMKVDIEIVQEAFAEVKDPKDSKSLREALGVINAMSISLQTATDLALKAMEK